MGLFYIKPMLHADLMTPVCRLMDSTQMWLDLAVGMLVLIYPQVQLRGDMGVLMSQALSQRSADSLGDLGTACQGMLQVHCWLACSVMLACVFAGVLAGLEVIANHLAECCFVARILAC